MGPLIASCTKSFHAYNLLQTRAHLSSENFLKFQYIWFYQSTHISPQIREVVRVWAERWTPGNNGQRTFAFVGRQRLGRNNAQNLSARIQTGVRGQDDTEAGKRRKKNVASHMKPWHYQTCSRNFKRAGTFYAHMLKIARTLEDESAGICYIYITAGLGIKIGARRVWDGW